MVEASKNDGKILAADFDQKKREFEKFRKNLGDVLSAFERAREWADLSNCLQKVKKTFMDHPNLPVPQKKELAKRLAQCLNPDLNVIHQLTLEVYDFVFERELAMTSKENKEAKDKDAKDKEDFTVFGQDLALFFSGLFSFYQFAAFEVKKDFMKLISSKVILFKKELVLSFPGFLVCMLPALDEQNSELLKQIEAILLKAEEIIGTSKFFGEIWKTIIRTPRCRLAGFKYLDRRIPKDLETATKLANEKESRVHKSKYSLVVRNGKAQLEWWDQRPFAQWAQDEIAQFNHLQSNSQSGDYQARKNAYFYFYYPNKETLVLNALLAGLQIGSQQQNYVNRATFDFLISHLQINGDYLNDKERIVLAEGTLNTLPQKDFASVKKFFNWFQAHLNEDEKPKKEDPAIKAVIEALKNIMSKQMKAADTKQEEVVTDTSHQVQQPKGPKITPITIILQLFSDNFIGEPILQEISVDLIKFIKHYYGVLSIGQLNQFEQRITNLVDLIEREGMTDCVWSALGYQISEELRQVSSDTETREIEAIDLITFFLQKLNKRKDKVDKQTQQTLDQIARQESMYNEQLLKEKNEHRKFLKMITPIFCCLLQGVESISNGMENTERTIPALDLIKEILDIMKVFQQQSQSYYAEDKSCHVPVKKFCQFYIKMLEYQEQQFKKNGQVSKFITAFQKASTILYEIQRYVDPSEFNTLPKWLEEIIKLCERGKKHDSKILLIGIGVFLKIIENNNADANMKKLQDLVRPSKSDSETNQQNYCMNIIQKLWSMLDEQSEHLQIVQLLKQFDLRLPRTFSSVVTSELANNKSREIKYKAVSKFAIFWKLTDKDYQTYKPFEPILFRENNANNLDNGSNELLDVVNSGTSMQDRQYIALQNMLGILDDQDPTLRLSCRSWLTESKDNFLRILDPLLKEFMDNNRVYKSFTGQVFFLEENYVPQNVIENFRKLRNIILNTQSEFIKYIVEKDISEHIRDQFDKQFDYITLPYFRKMDDNDKELKYCKDKYIYAIICITLQFIIGQAVESLNSQLFAATQTVNASACEFMELVMKSIHNKVSLSTEITHLIIGFLVKALRQAIDSKNNAQQVHLINLIQAIVIDGNFYAKPTQEKKEEQWFMAINKCANSLFIEDDLCDCIVDGIKSNQPIVRYHYITLSDRIVHFMQMHIEKEKQLKFIQKIITCYCELMLNADVKMYSLHFDKQARTHIQQQLQEMRSTIISKQQSVDSTRNVGHGQTNHDKQVVVITQENDIAQVIDGLRNIIAHCLEIKQEKEESEEGSNKPNREEQISQPKKGGLFGFFRGQRMDVTEMDRVKDGVFDKMLDIMMGVINCWNSTEVFKTRDHYFTRLGVFPWNKEDDITMKKQIREVTQQIQLKNDAGSVQKRNVRHFEKSEQDQTQENKNTDEIQISQEMYLKEHFNIIQTSIVNLLKPIAKRAQYRDKVVHAFLKIWGSSTKFREEIGMPVNEGCEKIIQILLSMGVPPDEMIESVQQYLIDQKWNVVKQPRDKPLDKDQKHSAMTQSLYCQFVYCYLLHCIHFNFETNFETSKKPGVSDDIIEINNHKQQFERMYINMMKFFKCFIYSRSPVTINWLLEILNVLSSKFKSQDSGFDKKLKLEFEQVLDTLLNTATLIITDQFGVTEYKDSFGIHDISFSPTVYEMLKRYQYIKQKNEDYITQQLDNDLQTAIANETSRGSGAAIEVRTDNENLRFEPQQLVKQDEIPMQKDSMFETINVVRFAEQIFTSESLGKFMENFNKFLHDKKRPLDDGIQRELFKVCTIVTLRQIMVNLVASIHNNDNKDGQYKSMSIVMQGVTSVITSHIRTLKTTQAKGQEKAKKHSDAVAEFLTEFIAYMASNKECQVLQKNYKADINRMFNDENFFHLNERMLRHWQTIVDNFIGQGEGDIFEEQLLKFNKMEGFFVNKNDVFQNKSLTFKRLAFLVFSGKNADFQDEQLENLLRKMTEGFKLQEKDYNMKQQLFLLSRILMLRLKANQLEDALRKLWPHLLNELVNVFDTYKASKEANEENIQLANQAMLIIELMSQLNIEDFLIDQWMFLFDGYGIEFKPVQKQNDNFEEQKTSVGVVDGNFAYRSQDVFQPYLVQFMCKNAKDDNLFKKSADNQEMRFYKVDTYRNITPSLRHFETKIQTSIQRRLTKAQGEQNENRVEEEDLAQIATEQDVPKMQDFIFRQVRQMQDKLARRNTQRPEVAWQNAEQLLEKEFIAKNDKKI